MPRAERTDGQLRLRVATSGDLPSLTSLDARCFAGDIRYSADVLAFFVRGKNSRTIVALREGEIAGFASAVIRSARGAHMVTVEVDPSARRSGIALTLLAELESWARRHSDRIFLEVDADNRAAIALYGKLGYLLAREFEEDGRDRLAMWKRL